MGIAATGDCMGDALRKQKKDVSKFTIDINSDGSLTFHSDGWPDLKLTKKTDPSIAVNLDNVHPARFIANMWKEAGLWGLTYCHVAVAIALAGSGGDCDAKNNNSDSHHSEDRGLWQINNYSFKE